MKKVLCVSLNPTLQRTLKLDTLDIGEVNRCTQVLTDVAGKGANTTRVLTQLGTQAVHLTHLGGENTDMYLRLAAEDRIALAYARCDAPVRICTTLIDAQGGTTTELVEEPSDVSPGVQPEIMDMFHRELRSSWMLIISGSIAPGYSHELYSEMVREAKDRNRMVLLDIRGQQLRDCLEYKPDFLKINAREFAQTFCDHASDEKVDLRMKQLYEQNGVVSIVTDGPHATRYINKGIIAYLAPRTIVPINPIGSGDAFTAGFVHALQNRSGISQCVRLGQECGMLNAGILRPGRLPDGYTSS
jgi:1-phosphofructokinase family hexose kinase